MDMERVPSLDTSGLGWLLRVASKFLQAGGRLVLHSVPPLVAQVLRFVQVTDLLPAAVDEQSARELALTEDPHHSPTLGNPSRPRGDFPNRKIS
jgi:anti-anti-sigma regulatory factor